MKKHFLLLAVGLAILLLSLPVNAVAKVLPIELNGFYSHHAFVNNPGDRALIFGNGFLRNDPFLDDKPDKGIIIPAKAISLSFNYFFFNGFRNNFFFSAWLFGDGTDLSFDTEDSAMGTVSWDLGGLFTKPTMLGLDFVVGSLEESDCDFSFVNIVDPVVTVGDTSTVPEPTTMMLLGFSVLGLAGFRWKRKIRR